MVYKYSRLFKWSSGRPIVPTEGPIPVYGSNGIIGHTLKGNYSNRIIIGRVGAYCGSVNYCTNLFFATDNTLIAECNENLITYKFAYYLFSLAKLNSFAGGSAQPLLTQGWLNRLKCDIPDLPIQRRIAEILSTYDDLIENNNKRIKLLEQMAENLYKEWFVRFRFPRYEEKNNMTEIISDWRVQKLENLDVQLESGSRPSGGIDASLDDGIPSLGAEAVNGLAEFNYSTVKLIPKEFYEKLKRGKSTGNDILVYKDGAYIGKTTLFRNGFPYKKYAVNEHVFLLKAAEPIFQNYLYFTLHQQTYFALMQNLNRNAAQPGLSQSDMKQIKIITPPLEIVDEFNKFVEPIFEQIFNLAHQNKELTKQRDLLLPRLMSGKLEV